MSGNRLRTGALLLALALILLAVPSALNAPVVRAAPGPVGVPLPAAPSPGVVGPKPVLVVMDLSSSMTEDDGTGTVKLAGAKSGLIDMINKQPPGAELGLWTYPTDGDCNAGGFVYGAELQKMSDPRSMTTTIQNLKADGNTPTAAALQSAAEAIRSYGRNDATIVLISDGLSNCTGDPCEVAKQLTADGFDITVDTVGFRISEDGAAQMQCISDATAGHYVSVEDSGQLGDVLATEAVPALALTPTVPTFAATGGTVTLSVDVSNPSSRPVSGVEVGLQFRTAGDATAVLPPVIPPRYALGTLAPGEKVTRKWTVQTTTAGKEGHLRWYIAAWGDRTLPVRKGGEINVTDKIKGGAGAILNPVFKSTAPAIVMGDSYSSGEGVGVYYKQDDDHAASCHRSPYTYAAQLLGDASRVKILACSGAVTGDLLAPQGGDDSHGAKAMRAQLEQLSRAEAPSAVFLTLGGNDIGFAELLKLCLLPGECGNALATGFVGINSIKLARLSGLYTEIFRRANTPDKIGARDGAIAPVIVLAYPMVLPADFRPVLCDAVSYTEVLYLNGVERGLNAAISGAVGAAQRDGSVVYFADTAQAVQPSNTMCDSDPGINDVSLASGLAAGVHDLAVSGIDNGQTFTSTTAAEFVHPNGEGYRRIALKLREWSSGAAPLPRPGSIPDPTMTPANEAGKVDTRIDMTAQEREKRIDATPPPPLPQDRVTVPPGAQVQLTGATKPSGGSAPNSYLVADIHSAPRALTVQPIGDDGAFDTRVWIPPDLPEGRHTITVTVMGGGYQQVGWEIPVTVRRALPWWFFAAVGVAPAALIGAGVLGWRSRRYRAPSVG